MERSLRNQFLTPNSSKTRVLAPEAIPSFFQFDENDFLSEFEAQIKALVKSGGETGPLEEELMERFEHFQIKAHHGNGDKVLKRYYTSFKRLNSHYLLERIPKELREKPWMDDKICDYLLGVDFVPEIVSIVTDYINSDNNLYPSTELRLLSLLLDLRIPSDVQVTPIIELANKMIFHDGFEQHHHSECLSSLLLAKYSSTSDIRKMAKFLENSGDNFDESCLRRHLLAVSFLLESGDPNLLGAIEYSKRRDDRDLSRLVNFAEEATKCGSPIPNVLKKRLRLNRVYSPDRKYLSLSTFVLLKMLCHSPETHNELEGIMKNLSKQNEDPRMASKLKALLEYVS